ncbi:hypothetical protein P7C73_g5369, partial [Tremellales sp. Uapishka_1]
MVTPYRQVASRFGCSISTVSRLVKQRVQTGSNYSPPRRSPPRKVSARVLSQIRRTLTKNRRLSPRYILPLLKEIDIHISLSTLQRVMTRCGLARRIARVKPFLNPRTRRLRFAYAFSHRNDGPMDWRRTIFTDEAAIRMNGTIRTWVTRRDKEAYLEECMVPKLLSAKTTVMVWGAIWHGGRSELVRFDTSQSGSKRKGVTASIYRDQITKDALKRCWTRVNTNWRAYGGARIVEDNASIHTAALNRSAGAKQKFIYLKHPPSSPDLNPIENCWAYLKRQLASLPNRPTTPDAMFEAARTLWKEVPQQVIDRTVDSMERRLAAVRKLRGFVTKY